MAAPHEEMRFSHVVRIRGARGAWQMTSNSQTGQSRLHDWPATAHRSSISFDIFDWPRLMLGNGPPVVRARPTLPTSNGRLEVGCAGEERRWICSRSYAANTSSG